MGPVQEAKPDRSSPQSKDAVGAPVATLYQPLPAGAGATEASIVGLVRSMSAGSVEVLSWLPATSTAVPSAVWSKPSPRTTGSVQDAMPDKASSQSKEAVGAPVARLYQPLPAGAGDREPTMDGAVRSTSKDPLCVESLLPATS
jgi:hypothetical protein